MLNKSWLFTVISMAVSVPLSLRSKSYNPVVYCGLTGTMLDLLNGYSKCAEQRKALEMYQQRLNGLAKDTM